jgi:8-oxo-dGTP diphosphatase
MPRRNVTTGELVARYGGNVHRLSKRQELAPERWERANDRDEGGDWGVGALVERDGRLLLVRQNGQWFLPGGMLEPGETHAGGAAREVREETGVDVEVTDLLALSEQTFVNAADGRTFEFTFATFRGVPNGTGLSDDPGLDDEGIERVAWHAEVPSETFDRELVVELRA